MNKPVKVIRNLIAIVCCLIIFVGSVGMCIPTAPKDIPLAEKISAVETYDNNTKTDIRDQVSSRGGYVNRRTEYLLYEFHINGEIAFYVDNLDIAKEYESYLLENTSGLNTEIAEITVDNLDLLTTDRAIDNIVQDYIIRFPIITTCYPTISHTISSYFGYRPSRGDNHTGIDISGRYGDNIYAYKKGKVVKVQYSNRSYGNMVLIEHEGMTTRYAHMSSINVVEGQYVDCGQIIGHVGSTGNSTGNHLHFEVIINGTPVNPYGYIF